MKKYSITTRKYRRVLIKLILNKLLNGNQDLIKIIIDQDYENEIVPIKMEHIEYDFYNWLNHDLVIRNSLMNQVVVLKAGILGFYQNNYERLGLLDYNASLSYKRNKSLNNCFHSKWWLTTHKSHFNNWSNRIHKVILSPYIIKVIHKNNFEMTDSGPQITQEDFEDFGYGIDRDLVIKEFESGNTRNPTIREKNKIIEEKILLDEILELIWLPTPDWVYNGEKYIFLDKNLNHLEI